MRIKARLKKWVEYVRRTNRRFDKMTASQKRVQIARDVIKQVELKRVTPTRGVYVENFGVAFPINSSEFSELSKSQLDSCSACALGSMFLSAVDRKNKLSMLNMGSYVPGQHLNLYSDDTRDYLGKFFSQEQLAEIEDSFEDDRRDDLKVSDKKHMVAIMENIIANGGKFKPSKMVKFED